jgi:glycosyltransferase involved in cell wall biosynthesis
VLPYAVALHAPADPRKHPVALPAKKTLFGCFFDTRSIIERKNPAALLRAFRRAFRKDDAVTLVLKVSHGSAAPAEMQELERLADGLPVLWLRDTRLDDFQMRSLLARLDVYVSLHRSEGFGLALAEAMAVRTAVVATGFSGNLEFMDAECARLVNSREIVTDRSFGPYPRGTRWADPDVEHAAEILRELHLDSALRRELGERGRQRIERDLAPWVIAETAKRLLGWGGGEPRGPRELHSVTAGRDSTTGRSPAAARAPAVLTARALPGE